MSCIARSLLVWVFILVLLFPIAACSSDSARTGPQLDIPAPAPPDPADTFTPLLAPTSSGRKATIMVPRFFMEASYEDVMIRLNKSLDSEGLNVEFILENNTFSSRSDEVGSYLPKVKAELLSGNTTADAYAVYYWNAAEITDTASTMDLTTLIPAVAPMYYGKHKKVFDTVFGTKITGLPIGMQSNSCRIQPSFMLRSDFEEQFKPEIDTISDVFSFVETNIIAPKKVCSIVVNPHILAELWAVEQGYYSLDSWNIQGLMCAGIDDKDCKPVALEAIPGFYDFISRMNRFYKSGYFVDPFNATIGWENIGIIRNLGDYYLPDAGNAYSWVRGEFVAHELNAELPSLYTDDSYFEGELLIPANSQKATDIIKFVDWMYSKQNNYNTIIYGEASTDYTVTNGRVSILKDGDPAVFKNRDEMRNIYMAWPGVQFFCSSDYNLLPQNAPVNIEKLYDNGKGVQRRFPLDELMMKSKSMDDIRLLDPTNEMGAVITERHRLLGNIIFSMFRPEDYKMSIKPLEKLKNDWLIGEYANKISKFKKSIDKVN